MRPVGTKIDAIAARLAVEQLTPLEEEIRDDLIAAAEQLHESWERLEGAVWTRQHMEKR
jgi:hypothetical protein